MNEITLKEGKISAPLHCQRCGGLLRLLGSEPHPVQAETDLLTYVCTACDNLLVLPVRNRANTGPRAARRTVRTAGVIRLGQAVIHPNCPECGRPMRLAKVEPDTPDHDRRTFECSHCQTLMLETVKFR
jgi:hypothetical protein